MHYILIFYMATWAMNDGGMVAFAAEFDDRPACEAAASAASKDFGGPLKQTPRTLCVPKGSGHPHVPLSTLVAPDDNMPSLVTP